MTGHAMQKYPDSERAMLLDLTPVLTLHRSMGSGGARG